MNQNPFFIGKWQVTPKSNLVRCGQNKKALEPKAMDVLILLCSQPGEVFSADELLNKCWGNLEIGDNPIHKAITQLRKALGDKASAPDYIETIRKRGYRVIAHVKKPLVDELDEIQAGTYSKSPFPGLSAFESSEAQIFFGRNGQIANLLGRLSIQVGHNHGFLLILGPSGTGKSSLVNAGLLPNLMSASGYDGFRVESHTSIDIADVSKGRLFTDFGSALVDWDVEGEPVFEGMSAEQIGTALQTDLQGLLERCQTALEKQNIQEEYHCADAKLFVFIDRLEVLLSSPIFSHHERHSFIALMNIFAISKLIIVVSACRNDFYPLVAEHASLMQGKESGSHFDLLAPTRSELMQMIRSPAKVAGLTWSADPVTAIRLDEILCDEAASNPDSLPMLQYTLQELYLKRENKQLTYEVYHQLGGIEGAIGKKAEDVFLNLPQHQQNQLGFLLSRLVTINPDGETVTSKAGRWSELKNDAQTKLVEALVDSRLLVSHLKQNQACFSLAHEALLRCWPRASQWIKTHQQGLMIKCRLSEASRKWLKEGKSRSYLLPKGKPLRESLRLKNDPVFVLDEIEEAFIDASVTRFRFMLWSRRGVIGLLFGLTVLSIVMSVNSYQTEKYAQQKRLEAESLLGFMVGDFADKLRSVKRMDLLDGISNKALAYFVEQQQDKPEPLFSLVDRPLRQASHIQHGQTLIAMGEVAYSRGSVVEAKDAFSSAYEVLIQAYQQNKANVEVLKMLGASAFWLGQLALQDGNIAQANQQFSAYRDYSQAMSDRQPDNPDSWLELGYAYVTIGSLALKEHAYPKAKEAFEYSLMQIDRVLQPNPKDASVQSVRADINAWIALTELHLGHADKALSIHNQVQHDLESLLKENAGNANFLELLAYSYWHQARILMLQEKYVLADVKATQAVTLFESALAQDKHNALWTQNLLSVRILKLRLANYLNQTVDQDWVNKINAQIDGMDLQQVVRVFSLIDLIRYYQITGKWQKSDEVIAITLQRLTTAQDDFDTLTAKIDVKLAQAELSFALDNGKHTLYCGQVKTMLKSLHVQTHNIELAERDRRVANMCDVRKLGN
jgi:DNA-binding winged helix-turn-helix (wHTH) protein/tetratricopeptide (TPR) repeat protein